MTEKYADLIVAAKEAYETGTTVTVGDLFAKIERSCF